MILFNSEDNSIIHDIIKHIHRFLSTQSEKKYAMSKVCTELLGVCSCKHYPTERESRRLGVRSDTMAHVLWNAVAKTARRSRGVNVFIYFLYGKHSTSKQLNVGLQVMYSS